MLKHRYKYNEENLQYEKVQPSRKRTLMKVGVFFLSTLFLAAGYYLLWTQIFDSPEERRLKNELEQLSLQYEYIQDQMGNMENTLNELQDMDDNLYRSIFEADPISASLRKAGTGGIRRYRELEGYKNSQLVIETTNRLDNLRNRIYVQATSYDELTALAETKTDMLKSVPAIMPIDNDDLKRTASGFGYRIHPIYKIRKFHSGIDFTASTGTPVYATGDGTVSAVTRSATGLGNHITIDHGYGYTSIYAHLNGFNVSRLQKVKRGDIIGYVGNTGLSVSPHLHYEVKYNGNYVDPAHYFFNDLTSDEYDEMIYLSSSAAQSFD